MDRYEIIVLWSAEDDAFVAEVPELPGCIAHGTTQGKALAAAKEAERLSVSPMYKITNQTSSDMSANSSEWHGDVLAERDRHIATGEDKIIDRKVAMKMLREELRITDK